MNITDVRVRKVAKEGKMKAVVSITIDDEFVVHDIKVIEGEKGLFIAMPSRKATDGEYRDIAHPINSSTRTQSILLQEMKFRTSSSTSMRKLSHRKKPKRKSLQTRICSDAQKGQSEIDPMLLKPDCLNEKVCRLKGSLYKERSG